MKNNILCLFVFLFVVLSGCTPLDDEDFSGRTDYLCRTWFSSFYDFDIECLHDITFYSDGQGKEIFTYYYPTGPKYEEYQFRWQWTSQAENAIEMKYGEHNILYFEEISLSKYTLSGYLDGDYLTFKSSY